MGTQIFVVFKTLDTAKLGRHHDWCLPGFGATETIRTSDLSLRSNGKL